MKSKTTSQFFEDHTQLVKVLRNTIVMRKLNVILVRMSIICSCPDDLKIGTFQNQMKTAPTNAVAKNPIMAVIISTLDHISDGFK